MGDLLVLVVLANIGFMIAALVDCITSDDETIRNLPKLLWILVILLFEGVGGVVWFIAGRPLVTDVRATHPAGRGRPTEEWATGDTGPDLPRQLAPDDDPEFLRSLAEAGRRADEERLRKWEADLRLREQRLRDSEDPPADR